jgi:hypothetical protein
MPTFRFDVSDLALDHTRSSTKGKAGNAGQESLLSDLEIDGYCYLDVYIAGDEVTTTSEGDIRISSSHPEAISIIIGEAYDAFEEFKNGIQTESLFGALNTLQLIREEKISEAFDQL